MSESIKKVSVVRCDDYNREKTCTAVQRAIDLAGGVGAFVQPGQKVFLKFNLLQGSAPETCVTTNPEVVYAVAKILRDHGCEVLLGDSPDPDHAIPKTTSGKRTQCPGMIKSQKISASI